MRGHDPVAHGGEQSVFWLRLVGGREAEGPRPSEEAPLVGTAVCCNHGPPCSPALVPRHHLSCPETPPAPQQAGRGLHLSSDQVADLSQLPLGKRDTGLLEGTGLCNPRPCWPRPQGRGENVIHTHSSSRAVVKGWGLPPRALLPSHPPPFLPLAFKDCQGFGQFITVRGARGSGKPLTYS